ncbi:multidrug resistance protein, MATE family [Strigomonas culicis]|uniref:Multidrug resistance protein, MATE family n=1 Tax=Strigomonas culicis TaxID=28005 RepID=S9UH75_9TRYP|nr:multidrug resistance protein, MATE family [Strigomonas culicis]EPY30132.1 multidrug resistance protein, MATE family [Strigomonas culicis]|eukprot:EPY26132.1 multidrug resistance protein, MATE family [Strigomonas culicis]
MTNDGTAVNVPSAQEEDTNAPHQLQLDPNISAPALVGYILVRCLPLGLAAVAQFSIGTALFSLVGRMVGTEQLGATTLAFGLLYATAFSASAGCCGALETLLSHSYGHDPNSKLYGVYSQRMAILLLIVAFLFGPLLAYADVILTSIGQNVVVARYTGEFCRIALFGVYPAMVLELLRRYFACQHMNNPLSVNLVCGAAIFPFLLFALISMFDYTGAPLGWVILQILMPASLFVYLWKTKRYTKTWGGWSKSALTNWGPMLKLAIPSCAMLLSEWAALEVNSIFAGFAPPSHLAAHSIVYQTSALMWNLTSGLYIVVTVLVGNAIGRGQNRFARRCALYCLVMTLCFSLVNIAVIFSLRHVIPYVFTTNQESIDLYEKLLKYFFVYHIFDLFQSCMMGVLRGCGLQTIGAVFIAIVYSVVGVPVGAVLFFKMDMGVAALWFGPAFGVTCIGFPSYVYLFFRYIKWDELTAVKEDGLSLGSEEDERVLRETCPPSECGDAASRDEGEAGDAKSPNEERNDAVSNFSFTSHLTDFVIPQRNNILLVGGVVGAAVGANASLEAAPDAPTGESVRSPSSPNVAAVGVLTARSR